MSQPAPNAIRPGSLRAWIMATRPQTLPVGAAPIIVGLSIVYGESSQTLAIVPAILCMTTALLLQILSNWANDYFDFKKGADTQQRIGPPRAMQQGFLTTMQMKRGLIGLSLLTAVSGSYLAWTGGPIYILLGVFAIVSAIAYTGGPFPLGYNGLGDSFVFIFFGLVAVQGTAHLVGGIVTFSSLAAATAMGLLATNLLVVNNIRDIEEDRRHGKKTLVARWGRFFGIIQYAVNLIVAYACVATIAVTRNNWFLGVTVLIVPIGIWNLNQLIRHKNGGVLNKTLAQTAMFTFLFALVFSISLVLGQSM